MRSQDIRRRRQVDYAKAGKCFETQARAQARAGNLTGAIAWARAAIRAIRGDRLLRGEAKLLLDRLLERQRDGGGS